MEQNKEMTYVRRGEYIIVMISLEAIWFVMFRSLPIIDLTTAKVLKAEENGPLTIETSLDEEGFILRVQGVKVSHVHSPPPVYFGDNVIMQ